MAQFVQKEKLSNSEFNFITRMLSATSLVKGHESDKTVKISYYMNEKKGLM